MNRKSSPSFRHCGKARSIGDANDYNVLVNSQSAPSREVVSVIDFGDMHHGLVVAEPAVAAAYALVGKSEPLAAAASLIGLMHRWRWSGEPYISGLSVGREESQ